MSMHTGGYCRCYEPIALSSMRREVVRVHSIIIIPKPFESFTGQIAVSASTRVALISNTI